MPLPVAEPLKMTMTPRRRAIWILAMVFIAGLLSNVGIELFYAGDKPPTPDVLTGRTIRLTVNHGSTIYVSDRELHLYDLVKRTTVVAMVISFGGIALLKILASPHPKH